MLSRFKKWVEGGYKRNHILIRIRKDEKGYYHFNRKTKQKQYLKEEQVARIWKKVCWLDVLLLLLSFSLFNEIGYMPKIYVAETHPFGPEFFWLTILVIFGVFISRNIKITNSIKGEL